MLLVGEVSSSIIFRAHNNSTEQDVKEIQVYKRRNCFDWTNYKTRKGKSGGFIKTLAFRLIIHITSNF